MKKIIAALTPLLLCAAPVAAQAAELETARYRVRTQQLILAGIDLNQVTRVTITDRVGQEDEVLFQSRRAGRNDYRLYVTLNDDAPGTFRLRIYDVSQQLLDAMDVTLPPAADAVTTTAIQQVTVSEYCQMRTCTAIASCPAGMKVVGGGHQQTGYYDTRITANRPESATSWRVDVEALNQIAYFTYAQAYAICMRVE